MEEFQSETFEKGKLYQLDINSLNANPDQPRKHFDGKELEKLRYSIAKNGVLQPILFRKDESDKLIVVAGERRFRAVKKEGLSTIQGIYFEGDHEEAALVENIIRIDLSPLEEAQALEKLKNTKKYTDDVIGSIVGKSRSTITEIISLNNLPDTIKDICISRKDLPRRELLKIVRTKKPEKKTENFNALIAKYDVIAEGKSTRRKLTNQEKLESTKKSIQSFTLKLRKIRIYSSNKKRRFLSQVLLELKNELEYYHKMEQEKKERKEQLKEMNERDLKRKGAVSLQANISSTDTGQIHQDSKPEIVDLTSNNVIKLINSGE